VALGRHITMEVNGVEGWKSKISKILVWKVGSTRPRSRRYCALCCCSTPSLELMCTSGPVSGGHLIDVVHGEGEVTNCAVPGLGHRYTHSAGCRTGAIDRPGPVNTSVPPGANRHHCGLF
jgi:hypothetical protein